MQVGQAQVVRSDWFDRTPQPKGAFFTLVVGPHGQTIRATYTVPANRICKIDSISMNCRRALIATALAKCEMIFQVRDGVGTLVSQHRVTFEENVVGDAEVVAFASGLMLTAGYYVEFRTADTATGGLIEYDLGVFGTEYDA